MRKRWELLALAVIALFIVVLGMLSYRDDDGSAHKSPDAVLRSSYRTYPEGYKALYLTLDALGYAPQRLIRPYAMLDKPGLLIVTDPYSSLKDNGRELHPPVSPYEARRLFSWLRRGNYALITLQYHPEYLQTLGKTTPQSHENTGEEEPKIVIREDRWSARFAHAKATGSTALPIAHTQLTASVPELAINSSCRFPKDELLPHNLRAMVDSVEPLYGDTAGVSVVYSKVGKGGIVWCSSPWSFSNQGIDQKNNLDLVLALAAKTPHGHVYFDEYHHGYGANMTVWNLAPLRTKLGVLQLAIALLLLFVTIGWRFGPVRLPAEERFTRSRAEYLTSMAGLLERARATRLVCNQLETFLRRELCRRLGIPATQPLDRVLAANATHPVTDPAETERVVNQLRDMAAQKPSAEALLRLSYDIHRLLKRKR